VPLGVVAIIYENRPNVTSDAFGLCLKSGNAAFLRGSSGAIQSNLAIAAVLRDALVKADLPADALVLVDDTSHEAAAAFMKLRDSIDCLIPRGGPSLIASVLENATVPDVTFGDGNCHVYVDESADLDMAIDIIVNAKTQRPSVCNAAESLLVHEAVAATFLPRAAEALTGVELVGDDRARAIVPMGVATDDDYATEFLDLKLSIRVVPSLDEAVKDADVVIWNGHPLSVYSSAETTFIDGEIFFDQKKDLAMRDQMAKERAALEAADRGRRAIVP